MILNMTFLHPTADAELTISLPRSEEAMKNLTPPWVYQCAITSIGLEPCYITEPEKSACEYLCSILSDAMYTDALFHSGLETANKFAEAMKYVTRHEAVIFIALLEPLFGDSGLKSKNANGVWSTEELIKLIQDRVWDKWTLVGTMDDVFPPCMNRTTDNICNYAEKNGLVILNPDVVLAKK